MSELPLAPVGFMSYARADDWDGRITLIRDRLSREVSMHLGVEFEIFMDNDIKWGVSWKRCINESLSATIFFFPVVTPTYFTRASCREEIGGFLAHEKRLKRQDLILPMYYVTSPLLEDAKKRATDLVAEEIGSRQRFNCRDMRFGSLTSPRVGRKFEAMAQQIVDALQGKRWDEWQRDMIRKRLNRSSVGEARRPTEMLPNFPARRGAAGAGESATERNIFIVDASGRGDYRTISEAVNAATDGTRIVVKAGHYSENLVIEKPLEIIGDGDCRTVVLEARHQDCIQFRATLGRITNLTIRQTGAEQSCAINVLHGRLDVDACDITSNAYSAVRVQGGADPWIRKNWIHDSGESGVLIVDGASATLEDNTIYSNRLAGVAISTGADPTLRRNIIYSGQDNGILVYENGRGLIEMNEIYDHAKCGIMVIENSDPGVYGNHICRNEYGISDRDSPKATFGENDLRGNRQGEWYPPRDHGAPGTTARTPE